MLDLEKAGIALVLLRHGKILVYRALDLAKGDIALVLLGHGETSLYRALDMAKGDIALVQLSMVCSSCDRIHFSIEFFIVSSGK